VRLTAADLAKVRDILEKIDQGLIHPQMPNRIGRFLRQYGSGRAQLDQVLAKGGAERRADAAVSGCLLGTIEVHAILESEMSLLGFPLGEVAGTLALSEELGGLTNVVMWLKGPGANAAYNLLRENRGLRLSGDYRWTPPGRLTPGEAQLKLSELPIRWQDARCLKAVADDLIRPPHALEYVPDYRMGPPGLKYFRCVCTLKTGQEWQVLPALARSRSLEVAEVLPEVMPALDAAELVMLLIYREPWSRGWTIVAGAAIHADDALAHAIAWADFHKELDGSELDRTIIAGIRESFRASGLRPAGFAEPNLARSLLPVPRDVLRWLRGAG